MVNSVTMNRGRPKHVEVNQTTTEAADDQSYISKGI